MIQHKSATGVHQGWFGNPKSDPVYSAPHPHRPADEHHSLHAHDEIGPHYHTADGTTIHPPTGSSQTVTARRRAAGLRAPSAVGSEPTGSCDAPSDPTVDPSTP